MEFGSTFVYDYSGSEEEWVSDDEYEDGMTYGAPRSPVLPTKESGGGSLLSSLASLPRRVRAKLPGSKAKKEKKHHWMSPEVGLDAVDAVDSASAASRGKRWRRADTNIVEVSFRQLTAPSNMHTGDPVYCDECKAVLSVVSKVEQHGDDQVWVCEFCGHQNSVDLMEDEIPKNDVVTFMLQPAACTTSSGRAGRDESLVIFCVDISGSMCVTTEVPGSVQLRGDRTSTLQGLNTDHSRQRLPGENRDITYVSRLQGVQAAVDHQLGEMQRDYPDRRAAIVTFNSEVVVIGDGSGDPVHISGDKLSDKEELIKIGEKLGLPKAVKDTRTVLGDKIFDLEEGGQTALGPALLVAVAMACQVQGSKVIICTDGMANVGLGCLDTGDSDDVAYDNASGFYTQVGQMAVDKGVSVSVISIKGTSCKLVELGQVAEATQGQVNIVDPLKLTEEFGSILANPVIATNVTATLLLHKHLYFRHEDSKESRIERKVGNVTKDTNITFEYGVRQEFRRPATDGMQVPSMKNPLYDTGEVQPGTQGGGDQVDASPQPDDGLTPPTPSMPAPTTDSATASASAGPNTVAQGDGVQAPHDTPSKTGDAVTPAADLSASAATGAATAASSSEKKREDALTELPFQLQIVYTDLDGAKALLVRSQCKPITKDRHVAEKGMNIAAVGAHAAQMSSKLALKGNFTPSRMNAFMYQRLVRRHTFETGQEEQYACYYDNVAPIETYVNARQQSEREQLGQCYSDDDDSDMTDGMLFGRSGVRTDRRQSRGRKEVERERQRSKMAECRRRRDCSDEAYQMLYAHGNSSSSKFSKE